VFHEATHDTSPSTINIWMLGIRPRTLPAAIAPILVGSALAYDADALHPPTLLAAATVALLLQVAANLANDGFDHARGADGQDRLGPLRVTQAGFLSYRGVMLGAAVAIGLAAIAGSYLVYRGGWPVFALGVAAIVAALAYTGGPLPLGYHGLGEVAVFLFFGLIGVAGSYYVQSGSLPAEVLLFSLPVGALIAAILVDNNLRDIRSDAHAGKRTLAVRFGRRWSIVEYELLVAGAYLVLPLIWVATRAGWLWALPWLSLPLAIVLVRAIGNEEGRMLNRRLGQTAQLALIFSVLLGIAVAL
jgi:1,4-dihydroxy-2-naphthoate octaprenyltransferase